MESEALGCPLSLSTKTLFCTIKTNQKKETQFLG